ncbi:MAG: MFS transporter [Saprospiraceae bacterium]|nr:MFS transporter [Saprospiraceae bacterium]
METTKLDPYAALRYADFRFFLGTQFTYTVAVLIQEVVLGYYLYEVTGDPLALGLIGLFEAIPYLALALFGGHAADLFDKKNIARISILAMITISSLLMYGLHLYKGSDEGRYIIYAAVFLIGVARGFLGPAWSSIKAFLVDQQHYSNAASWASQFWQGGMITGPAVAGFLYAYLGLEYTLFVVIGLFVLSFLSASMIKAKSHVEKTSPVNLWQSLREGYHFVTGSRILIYAIALDMFSVLFGGVIAILPVFAKDILQVGPEGLGILRAAPGIGAVLTMFGTAFYPPTRKAWRNMLLAVLGFGLATLVFALSKNFYLSIAALFFTGAFDSISVVVRQTILQVLPPDEMRGRVNSINGIFVSCSNELGAFESGVAAKLLGTVPSVIFGASMTIVSIGIIYYKTRDLLGVNLLDRKR